ncbi:MAG: alpha/beta hydrolase [Xanthomonadales bacterium]|nr:alpha/beta fold hydrolase [Gammaproteobacteria bacterium]NNK03677.1 alpha/beta hydrolase [Xanthomonadales bacterium]
MNRIFAVLSCLCINLFAYASEVPVNYPAVESNVSYKQVTALGFRPADARLVYANDNPELQYGLLWLPAVPQHGEKAPLVVLIHGGCWLNVFDIQHTLPMSTALAQAGYAVWSLEYRRTGDPGGGWPGTFEDIKAGLAYLPKLGEYPLDLERIAIAGHSAGGHLALLAGNGSANAQAVIGLAAITDIIEYSKGGNSCQTAAPPFMGGTYAQKPEAYAAANPAGKPIHPNTLLLQGDLDNIVPLHQSSLLGITPRVQEGTGHFDWVHPGTAAFQRLLATLDEILKP